MLFFPAAACGGQLPGKSGSCREESKSIGKRDRRGNSNIWSNGLIKGKGEICPESQNIEDMKKRMGERNGDQSLFVRKSKFLVVQLFAGYASKRGFISE